MTKEEKKITELESQIASLEGQIAQITNELDKSNTAIAHAVASEAATKGENETLLAKVAGYEKASREELVARVHAVKKDYDCEGKPDDRLESFIEGYDHAEKTGPKSHATDDPAPTVPGAPASNPPAAEGNAKAFLGGPLA